MAFAENILITDIVKTVEGDWTVSYRSNQPVNSIQFSKSPDTSRIKRWELLDDGFEFRVFNQKETVVRRDNQTFTSVTFKLTPTYIHLPKYYAPFSPFSDGSMLLHSARFFACSNFCSGRENTFYLTLTAPENDQIIVNEHNVTKHASWYDSNDGQKVFVGRTNQLVHPKYRAVIDDGLPESIVEALNLKLPLFIEALESRLLPMQGKPTLYASYSKDLNVGLEGRFGRQGGVLANQVFMHWYGKVVEDNHYELLWFFAHEAVHMYQGYSDRVITPEDAWIHEGYADFIAGKLLVEYFPASIDYVKVRSRKAKQACINELNENSIEDFASMGQYQTLYQCGLYFLSLIHI